MAKRARRSQMGGNIMYEVWLWINEFGRNKYDY